MASKLNMVDLYENCLHGKFQANQHRDKGSVEKSSPFPVSLLLD